MRIIHTCIVSTCCLLCCMFRCSCMWLYEIQIMTIPAHCASAVSCITAKLRTSPLCGMPWCFCFCWCTSQSELDGSCGGALAACAARCVFVRVCVCICVYGSLLYICCLPHKCVPHSLTLVDDTYLLLLCCTACDLEQLSAMARSLATIGVNPGSEWITQYLEAVHPQQVCMRASECVCVYLMFVCPCQALSFHLGMVVRV